MRRLLVTLMLLVATLEAAAVPVYALALARKPAHACTCECGCHCMHCRVHRDHQARAADGMAGMDCSGCAAPVNATRALTPAMPYEVPATVTVPEARPRPHDFSPPPPRPHSLSARQPDPPPRRVVA